MSDLDSSTWADLLAAQKPNFPVAMQLVPLVVPVAFCQTSASVVWFFFSPECDFPGTAIHPLPGALLSDVVASYPENFLASVLHSLDNIFSGGIWADSSQVAALIPAEVLSSSPIFFVRAPAVAVVTILLPWQFAAGFNALVAAAPWPWWNVSLK